MHVEMGRRVVSSSARGAERGTGKHDRTVPKATPVGNTSLQLEQPSITCSRLLRELFLKGRRMRLNNRPATRSFEKQFHPKRSTRSLEYSYGVSISCLHVRRNSLTPRSRQSRKPVRSARLARWRVGSAQLEPQSGGECGPVQPSLADLFAPH